MSIRAGNEVIAILKGSSETRNRPDPLMTFRPHLPLTGISSINLTGHFQIIYSSPAGA